MTEAQIRRVVWVAEWQCYGHDRADGDYWVSKWAELEARGIEIGHPDYALHRVQGMGAGGADVALYGPYADPPRDFYGPVPPYPGEVPVPPTPEPPPSPPAPSVDLTPVLARLDRIEAAVIALAAKQPPVYRGPYGIVLRPE